ncbi:alpha/beta fold hydrolase [Leifsonia sp. 2MCAF36]|uniref:alpha/beta fold hydrolase n=1 Tax=Leifsonia sp. 2MCAF36 TaxID=3232988 RepID=UPI003F9731D6
MLVSLVAGFVCALLLSAAPFVPATENGVTGAVLFGFGLGWATLAMLSVWFTDRPQRWAAVPAFFMGVGGLLLFVLGSSVRGVIDWVWPPALLALAVWMIFCIHRQLPSRAGRWLLYPVVGFLALASVGGGYAIVGAAADASAYPMPGRLIDVGGHRLHLNCTGSGSPTVVLQPGAGEMSSNLGWIASAVATATRVCVYDRAGRGWSDSADTPQDGTQIATDLHTLLHNGHIPGPYVLAGHSFGGLYVQSFAALYPEEVAGMVLVDSTDTALAVKSAPALPGKVDSYDVMGRAAALASITARLGLTRLYAPLEGGNLPPRSRDEVRANIATASSLRSTIDEYLQSDTSMRQAAALRDFADKPLIVLTAGIGSGATHLAEQNHLATLSTNSLHRITDGADHEGMVATQKGAAATTQAILDVLGAASSHTLLR